MAASTSTEDINELFRNLKINVQQKSDLTDILKELSNQLNNYVPGTLQITSDIVDQFIVILNSENDLCITAAEIIAKLATNEKGRAVLSNENIVSRLCQYLGAVQVSQNDSNFSLAKQACRALGNLCYENDKCRKYAQANNGLKVILDIVKQAVDLGKNSRGAELRSFSVGLLLNFVVGYEELDAANLRAELIDLLCDVLECGVSLEDDEAAGVHCMVILEFLADVVNSPILNERLCNILVNLLRDATSDVLVELCMEMLHSQAAHHIVALSLAKAGMCELLIQLLEEHKNLADDVDTENLFKMACDLIIIILNDDESMALLFNEGKGRVFQSMVSWLSSNVKEFQVSGVLAIGNFARADGHCIEMVNQGISKQLIKILSNNNTDKGDIKLQHALLSALRNLVIPDQNKTIVIKDGLLETLYPMISVSSHPVVFKLLGTFRIVMDRQDSVAQELAKNKDLIRKVVEWSGADHPGVQGESTRLLAWLVKNCRNELVSDTMIECNAIPRLIEMIVSDHEVMQNEAIFAVTILSSVRLNRVEKIFIDEKIAEKIVCLIKDKNPKKEVFANILTLIRQLSSSSTLEFHLCQSGVQKAVTEYLEPER